MTDLKRFKDIQNDEYGNALKEIKNGKKVSHWMWYIFPQLKELGSSYMAKYYGIENIEEAREYLSDNYLRNNLIKISEELLLIDKDIEEIMGFPDYLKLQSCMTLFNIADSNIEVFNKVLDKFYNGEKDKETIRIIKENSLI